MGGSAGRGWVRWVGIEWSWREEIPTRLYFHSFTESCTFLIISFRVKCDSSSLALKINVA